MHRRLARRAVAPAVADVHEWAGARLGSNMRARMGVGRADYRVPTARWPVVPAHVWQAPSRTSRNASRSSLQRAGLDLGAAASERGGESRPAPPLAAAPPEPLEPWLLELSVLESLVPAHCAGGGGLASSPKFSPRRGSAASPAGTRNPRSAQRRNPEPKVSPEPGTRNPEPGTRNPIEPGGTQTSLA